MFKMQKNSTIFLLILLQSLLSISAGLIFFFLSSHKTIAPDVYVGQTDVGRLSRVEASKSLESNLGTTVQEGFLVIQYAKDKIYRIKYSDIDAVLDIRTTIDDAYGKNLDRYKNLFDGYFIHKSRKLYARISYNEEKLQGKLKELAALVEKKPVDANIRLVDGKIIKKQEVYGQRLNLEKALLKVKRELSGAIGSTIAFKPENNDEIEVIPPQYSLEDFKDAIEVISQYSTDIKSAVNEDSIMNAAHAINKVMLRPLDVKAGLEAGVFSFNKYLKKDDALLDNNDEGYNQVASTLNAAVVNAGLGKDGIVRTAHKTPVDYIQTDLDAVVLSNKTDYQFKNTSNSAIIIFAQVSGNKLTVSLVGRKHN